MECEQDAEDLMSSDLVDSRLWRSWLVEGNCSVRMNDQGFTLVKLGLGQLIETFPLIVFYKKNPPAM